MNFLSHGELDVLFAWTAQNELKNDSWWLHQQESFSWDHAKDLQLKVDKLLNVLSIYDLL